MRHGRLSPDPLIVMSLRAGGYSDTKGPNGEDCSFQSTHCRAWILANLRSQLPRNLRPCRKVSINPSPLHYRAEMYIGRVQDRDSAGVDREISGIGRIDTRFLLDRAILESHTGWAQKWVGSHRFGFEI